MRLLDFLDFGDSNGWYYFLLLSIVFDASVLDEKHLAIKTKGHFLVYFALFLGLILTLTIFPLILRLNLLLKYLLKLFSLFFFELKHPVFFCDLFRLFLHFQKGIQFFLHGGPFLLSCLNRWIFWQIVRQISCGHDLVAFSFDNQLCLGGTLPVEAET